ncbi:MAG: DNA polymerase III subunit gamma/tau [Clostridia bacterium]|nr:DNA polymerase III subunit gamma/tau [Clostridia bacterium]
MYKALYRKWRPKYFKDVVGQNHVTDTLKREIEKNKISHAYLFTGSRGTGKTSSAKIFAKAVNCLKPKNGEPCGKCEICKEFDNDNLIDILEIDAASNNGVENIRSMREEVMFAPAKCKYRVYIVDEVHMLSTGAFNAFLKILEEPPAHVIFILATTEVHKIPLTILSRCQRFDFYRIQNEDISKRLKYICSEEKIKIDEKSLELISSAADGAMRDALSILDQCSNVCGDDIKEDSVKNLLGISGTEYINKLAQLIFENNISKCLEIIENLHSKSKNMARLCEEIMAHFRDLMIKKASNPQTVPNLTLDNIISFLDSIQNAYKNISTGTNPKLEMEILIVKLCSLKNKNLETKPAEKSGENQDTPPGESFSEVKKPEILDSLQDENSFELWPQILSELAKEKKLKSLYMALKDSKAYQNKNYILIDSDKSLAFEYLRNSEHRSALKNIILKITGKYYNLGPYNKDTQKEEAEDPLDNLINKAKENNINIDIGGKNQ